MWKIVLVIMMASFFAGCETTPTNQPNQPTEEKPTNSTPTAVWDQVASQYNYLKDKRTENVCIGMWQSDYRTTFYVPCDQVQHLLKNP